MSDINWTCPYCARIQTVTDKRVSVVSGWFYIGEHAQGDGFGLHARAIACANASCKEVTVGALLGNDTDRRGSFTPKDILTSHRLKPDAFSKIQPDYVPIQIREDYYEACKIRDLSPKAAATLARRCIQGMIRNFCNIKAKSLFDEIEQLKSDIDSGAAPRGVSEESAEALHHVRKIGNIGAHMEKDVDLIVNVEPNEAQALIEITEMLFEEWYVARKLREDRLGKVQAIATAKEEQRQLK
jgi:Domain of unknown function (DUF4145)